MGPDFYIHGVRVYNGAPIAEEIMKYDTHYPSDKFLHPIKIEPEKNKSGGDPCYRKEILLRIPQFYFYEKENIIPGWLLITGNYILKVLRSRQPVWRLLIFLKRVERFLE